MVALYITSLERGAGKTTVCAGLGRHLLNEGKKTGFFKPVIAESENPPVEGVDSDAIFMKRLLALDEPVDLLSPVLSDKSNLRSSIKEAYAKVSQGKDIMIIEGASGQSQAYLDMLDTLDAKVIIVEDNSRELPEAKRYQDWKRLLGVILNKVPSRRVEQVRNEVSSRFERAGVNILGVLPEDIVLFAPTIGELAEHIQGEILSGSEKSAELVENIMLGALYVDHAPEYFGRKANKAVVLRSERPDMQMAALETSTRCLVITGEAKPHPSVLHRAEEKKVPIISARGSITAIVTNIEDVLGKTRFNQENKLPRLTEIMEQHFNFRMVYKGLGLAS